ncbi:MAG TPA: PIN domain-containing protein [Thermoanaerobaculia bacterium]|nr:PIN domain-containing protein [Thermoanaerobaculia bacterium]
MRVLFDTNVVLDVVLDREPFRDVAAELVSRVERGDMIGVLGATTLTTIYYLSAKQFGRAMAHSTVRDLLSVFKIAAVDLPVLARAIESALEDFEDAVLHEAGIAVKVDAVVTRDPEDFRRGRLPIFSPQQLRASLSETPPPPPS